jgi:hypothetical protein
MNVIRLQVVSTYRARQVAYQKGTIIEVTEDEAEFLLRDAPGCFEIAPDIPRADEPPADEPPAGKAPKRPPLDKMISDEDTDKK